MNLQLAEKVITEAVQLGVHEFCLCAGARNSPLVVLLEKAKVIQVHSFFEERSASFFALGRAKKTGRPVAIVTTSGTAVAELLPAAVEATYTGQPLLFITADRPRDYRGKGAPQSIEQIGIFSHYVQSTIDIAYTDEKMDLKSWNWVQPLHLNVCFDEPLIDGDIKILDFTNEVRAAIHVQRPDLRLQPKGKKTLKRPFVIVGEVAIHHVEKITEFLIRLQAPVYAEAISNLRGIPELASLLVAGGEKIVGHAFEQKLCDTVLRIGGIPTLRFWRDLEGKFKQVPVTSISEVDYTGLSRNVDHKVGYHSLELFSAEHDPESKQKIFKLDQELSQKIQDLQKQFPSSEINLLKALSEKIENQNIYLGNSLPIREWDLITSPRQHFMEVHGNRGANGIDGQLSTFLGLTETDEESWCVVGDLTAMYDLIAPWAARKLASRKLRIVVINNGGGRIFQNMFASLAFQNQHDIRFEKWADMWGWSYLNWQEIPQQLPKLSDRQIIEINPNETESKNFWQEYSSL